VQWEKIFGVLLTLAGLWGPNLGYRCQDWFLQRRFAMERNIAMKKALLLFSGYTEMVCK
jgi:hypothetical protein